MYLVVWRKELTDIEIDEHMNQEVHGFQKPKNFVRTLRKWISDKSIYLTADVISGFAIAAPQEVPGTNAITGNALQPSGIGITEL